jgi:hypothetical protein
LNANSKSQIEGVGSKVGSGWRTVSWRTVAVKIEDAPIDYGAIKICESVGAEPLIARAQTDMN